uniref:Uncharacterized protein n=1 Tax=Knipowitschia caucasica TaxID=637954 RepID=A0AAV2LVL6_KNICA
MVFGARGTRHRPTARTRNSVRADTARAERQRYGRTGWGHTELIEPWEGASRAEEQGPIASSRGRVRSRGVTVRSCGSAPPEDKGGTAGSPRTHVGCATKAVGPDF